MIERIDHVNIVVSDMDAMVAFYREALGLRETRRATIGGPWIQKITGLEAVRAEVVYLEPASGPGLELIRYLEPEGSRPGALSLPQTPGLRHLALCVEDLDAVVGKLSGTRARFLGPPQTVPDEQVEYVEGKRLVYCLDPEGNLLELCAFGSRSLPRAGPERNQ